MFFRCRLDPFYCSSILPLLSSLKPGSFKLITVWSLGGTFAPSLLSRLKPGSSGSLWPAELSFSSRWSEIKAFQVWDEKYGVFEMRNMASLSLRDTNSLLKPQHVSLGAAWSGYWSVIRSPVWVTLEQSMTLVVLMHFSNTLLSNCVHTHTHSALYFCLCEDLHMRNVFLS